MAIASASAASGEAGSAFGKRIFSIKAICCFSAWPAPTTVFFTWFGAGHADKNQVLIMLKILLPKAEPKSPDAADALAVAITHAHHRASAMLRLKVVGI